MKAEPPTKMKVSSAVIALATSLFYFIITLIGWMGKMIWDKMMDTKNIPTKLYSAFKKSPGFWILFKIYIIAFFADFLATIALRDLVPHLELNPLFQHFGNFQLVAALNVAVIILLPLLYLRKKAGPASRFSFITLMMVVIAARIVSISNALTWKGMNQAQAMAEAVSITPEAKAASLAAYAFLIYMPIILVTLSYAFWRLDHKVERRS